MKKNLNIMFWVSVFIIGAIACTGKSNEEKVTEFALDFADKASNNQIDSLKSVYPDIENADSIAIQYGADEITIKLPKDGSTGEIIYSPDLVVKFIQKEDGTIKVTESKGLFVFPEEKVIIAKSQGMWNEDANDVERLETIEESYLKYLEELKKETETTLSANNFFKFSKGKIDFYKSPSEMNRYLLSQGFSLVSSSKEKGDPYADTAPEQDDWITKIYSNDGISVETVERGGDSHFVINSVQIKFKNIEQTDFFVKNMKSSGWKIGWTDNYEYSAGYNNSIISISRKRNKIDFIGMWE